MWPVKSQSSSWQVGLLDISSRLLAPLFRGLSRPYFFLRDWLCLTCLRAALDNGVPPDLQLNGVVRLSGTRRVQIGKGCRLGRDVVFDTVGDGDVQVGEQVTLNNGVFIVSHSSISIGPRCLVGEYVSIRDADHGISGVAPPLLQEHAKARIAIGPDVWLGRGSVVLKGVTIGEGAVVAANSVVNRDVPPFTVVAGVPARVVKVRSDR